MAISTKPEAKLFDFFLFWLCSGHDDISFKFFFSHQRIYGLHFKWIDTGLHVTTISIIGAK